MRTMGGTECGITTLTIGNVSRRVHLRLSLCAFSAVHFR